MSVVDGLESNLAHCLKKSSAHARCASNQKIFGYFLGIPSSILSALVGSAVYDGIGPTSDFYYLVMSATFLSAILTGIQTVVQPGAESKLHLEARNRYAKAIHKIKNAKTRFLHSPDDFDISVLDEIDLLVQDARDIEPAIPNRVWDRLEK